MAKIMVLVPNQKMEAYTRKIIEEDAVKSCEVQVIQTEESVQAARYAIEQGATAIVARGLQAAMIKEYTRIPLVEIVLTGQELGLLIQEARAKHGIKHPKLAFIGHSTMFPDCSYMSEIFQVDMRIYGFEDFGIIEKLVADAVADGADLIIGGERVLKCAKSYSVPTLFLSTKEDSLREALQVARKVVYTSQVEKENNAQFETVLDTVYNGILRVDLDKKITTVNYATEQILGDNEKHMVGAPIQKIMRDLEEDYVDRVLQGKRDVLNTSIVIGKENYMVSIAPIMVDKQITGAIISMNRLQAVKNSKQDIIYDNFLSGYLTNGDFSKIESKNGTMKQCIELARMYALSTSPVIIYGETGTEKELFAQGIHNAGIYCNSHYMTVNCSGMTESQQIAALFGVEGEEVKTGALEQAAFGTLVIHDIDELCPRCQYRLLRILRHKTFMKTDIEVTPASEVRIISTARKELGEKVRNGQFREDLYYFFSAFSLHIPPLRERKEDIADLVTGYLRQYNRKYARRVSLTNGGKKAIYTADWKGNALQLERFCERLVLTVPKRNADEIIINNMLDELYPVCQQSNRSIAAGILLDSPEGEKIHECLIENNGSRQMTASQLGISPATLWRKMKKYGITE